MQRLGSLVTLCSLSVLSFAPLAGEVAAQDAGSDPGSGAKFDDKVFNDVIGIGGGAGGPYGGRFGGRHGHVSKKARAPLRRATEWLAASQTEDGSWPADGSTSAVRTTSLALLALLGDGHTLRMGEQKRSVVRGVKWLRGQQDTETGRIGTGSPAEHAMATVVLCEIFYFSRSPLLGPSAKRAVRYALDATLEEGDVHAACWTAQALKAAEIARIPVDEGAAARLLAAVDGTAAGGDGTAAGGDVGELAAALLTRVLLGRDAETSEPVREGVERLLATLDDVGSQPSASDLDAWTFGSCALRQLGGDAWSTWSSALVETLRSTQHLKGDVRGSWDPVGAQGPGARVDSTARMALCLEADFRLARLREDP